MPPELVAKLIEEVPTLVVFLLLVFGFLRSGARLGDKIDASSERVASALGDHSKALRDLTGSVAASTSRSRFNRTGSDG